MIVLQNASDSGLSAYTVTPSLFLTAAIGAGNVGMVLKSFGSQVRVMKLFERCVKMSLLLYRSAAILVGDQMMSRSAFMCMISVGTPFRMMPMVIPVVHSEALQTLSTRLHHLSSRFRLTRDANDLSTPISAFRLRRHQGPCARLRRPLLLACCCCWCYRLLHRQRHIRFKPWPVPPCGQYYCPCHTDCCLHRRCY